MSENRKAPAPITEREENIRLKQHLEKLQQELEYARKELNEYTRYKVAFLVLVETLGKRQ